MEIFQILLVLSAFLCSLVAGLLFTFAIVVMPGIKKLNDREFLRAFQVMDGIIQNNQPLFMIVWLGSFIVLIASAVMAVYQIDGFELLLLINTTLIYFFTVQLPTVIINIPLNNKLQTLDVDSMDATMHKTARNDFEMRWVLWNKIRTVFSCLVSINLIILLFML